MLYTAGMFKYQSEETDMNLCDQLTTRGEPCTREATWTHVESNGATEFYCTQHANIYDPNERLRRLGSRWTSLKEATKKGLRPWRAEEATDASQ